MEHSSTCAKQPYDIADWACDFTAVRHQVSSLSWMPLWHSANVCQCGKQAICAFVAACMQMKTW